MINKVKYLKDDYTVKNIEKIDNMTKSVKDLYDILYPYFNKAKELVNQPLNLAIMGEFSVGKSSFINKLLGTSMLPIGVTPITSSITIIKYGDDEKVEIHYNQDGDIKVFEYEGYQILKEYSNAKKYDSDSLIRERIDNIQKIIVYYKSDVLKNFNLIDTPGFNHNANIDEITLNFSDNVDFVVWLVSASQAGKKTELEFLSKIKELCNNIFLVVNQADYLDVSNFENTMSEISKELIAKFGDFIINREILGISSKIENDFFNEKYKSFLSMLKDVILDKDRDISIEQIKIIYDKIKDEIKNYESELSNSLRFVQEKRNEYNTIFSNSSFKEIKDKYLTEVVMNIENSFDSIVSTITNSKSYKSKASESLIEFLSLYKFHSEIILINRKLSDVYIKYINYIDSIIKDARKSLKDYLLQNKYSVVSSNFENEVYKKFDNIEYILIGYREKSNKLLTNGYLLGLASENYFYHNFFKKDKSITDKTSRDQSAILRNEKEKSFGTEKGNLEKKSSLGSKLLIIIIVVIVLYAFISIISKSGGG